LECGCGAGHDTEALLGLGAKVISFDLSNSVDVAVENNGSSNEVLILQADIFKVPLQVDLFDVVYCHRVIQHTPQPESAFYSIARHARKGGDVFLHSYSTHWRSMVHWKYALRPITTRMSHERVFKLLTFFGPFLYRTLGVARKLGLKSLRRAIPFENSERKLNKHNAQLTDREKYEYSLTTVFDALTPKYDIPNSPKTITKWFQKAGCENIVVRKRRPVVVVGSRKTD
jgi:SAM-dependent methyltransferase